MLVAATNNQSAASSQLPGAEIEYCVTVTPHSTSDSNEMPAPKRLAGSAALLAANKACGVQTKHFPMFWGTAPGSLY